MAKKKLSGGRSAYTDDQKREYVRRIAAGETIAAIARETGVSSPSVSIWAKKFKPRKGDEPARPNGHAPAAETKLGLIGLRPLIENLMQIEMVAALERRLPAALDAALARRFGARDAKEG